MVQTKQLLWGAVSEGDVLPEQIFPLSTYRLIMAASGTQDFNSIHHNSEYAKATGAPEMYANNIFLQGMWERTVRQYVGNGGVIKSLRNFRMGLFNTVGQSLTVKGRVERKWQEKTEHLIEIILWTENAEGVTTVGPGSMIVALPIKE